MLADEGALAGRARALPWLGLVVLLGTVFVLGAFDLYNNDIGYHVAYGRWILENGEVPTKNVFTTAPFVAGRPIHDDKWLFQVVVALADRAGGPPMLVALRILLVAALAGCLLGLMRTELPLRGPLPWLGTLLALWVVSERFLLRPELPAYALMAGMLWQLDRLRRGRGRLWVIGAIGLVWVNVHGTFILGPCLVGALLVADLIRRWRRKGDPTPKRWAAALLVLVGVSLLNPNGIETFLYPVRTLHRTAEVAQAFQNKIVEFRPSLDPESFLTHTAVLYRVLLLGAPLAMLLAWRRHASPYRAILLVAFIAMSLPMRRNIALLGVVGSWLMVTSLGRLGPNPRLAGVARGAGWAAVLIVAPLLLLQAGTDRLWVAERRNRRFGFGESNLTYCRGACDFIRREDLRGVYFNHPDTGSYMLWRLGRERLPLCTSDLGAIQIELHVEWVDMMERRRTIDWYTSKHGIDYWVVQHDGADNIDLASRLARDPRWALVYLDPLTAVFLPRGRVRYATVIDRLEIDLPRLEADAAKQPADLPVPRTEPRGWLSLLSFRRQTYPKADVALGSLYLGLGHRALARQAFARALSVAPDDPRLLLKVGGLLALDERFAEAEVYLRAAVEIKDDYAPAHHGLGRVYMGHMVRRLGDARRHLTRAVELRPDIADFALSLGELLVMKEKPDEAAAVYERALIHSPDDAVLHRRLGELHEAGGRSHEAVTHYRRSLELRPDQPELVRRIRDLLTR